MNPNSPLAPSPLSKDEPPSGLDCSGDFKAAPDIRVNGPAAGGGYLLPVGQKVKVRPPGPQGGLARKAVIPCTGLWLTTGIAANSNPNNTGIRFLKIAGHPERPLKMDQK